MTLVNALSTLSRFGLLCRQHADASAGDRQAASCAVSPVNGVVNVRSAAQHYWRSSKGVFPKTWQCSHSLPAAEDVSGTLRIYTAGCQIEYASHTIQSSILRHPLAVMSVVNGQFEVAWKHVPRVRLQGNRSHCPLLYAYVIPL